MVEENQKLLESSDKLKVLLKKGLNVSFCFCKKRTKAKIVKRFKLVVYFVNLFK